MDKAEQILSQIFGSDLGWVSGNKNLMGTSPNYDQIKELAVLLSSDPGEEALQQFLETYPQFLMSMYGYGDDQTLAVLVKPPIGTRYNADFAILEYGQKGCEIHLIEIEPSSATLFTKKNTPATRLQQAIGQVHDWHQWIEINKQTFVRDTVEYAKSLPMFPERAGNNSYQCVSDKAIEQIWHGFGGYEDTMISSSIIIGQWSELSDEHRKRLIFLNKRDRKTLEISTFDQVARRGFIRPNLRI
ncbi:DUF4263 domain-containing protein [Nostoc sp. CHAB 5824]|nr:DUF4263 domain-containing protein [Nostoc sp. CHAB 5824]